MRSIYFHLIGLFFVSHLCIPMSMAKISAFSFKEIESKKTESGPSALPASLSYLSLSPNKKADDKLAEIIWDDPTHAYSHDDFIDFLNLHKDAIASARKKLRSSTVNLIDFDDNLPFYIAILKGKKYLFHAIIDKNFPLDYLLNIQEECELLNEPSSHEILKRIEPRRHFDPSQVQSSATMDHIEERLKQTQAQLESNIVTLLHRGEHLEILCDKTQSLELQAERFRRSGKELHHQRIRDFLATTCCCGFSTLFCIGAVAGVAMILI